VCESYQQRASSDDSKEGENVASAQCIIVELAALLLRIREAMGSSLGPEIAYLRFLVDFLSPVTNIRHNISS
jgi:hypothetical protein